MKRLIKTICLLILTCGLFLSYLYFFQNNVRAMQKIAQLEKEAALLNTEILELQTSLNTSLLWNNLLKKAQELDLVVIYDAVTPQTPILTATYDSTRHRETILAHNNLNSNFFISDSFTNNTKIKP